MKMSTWRVALCSFMIISSAYAQNLYSSAASTEIVSHSRSKATVTKTDKFTSMSGKSFDESNNTISSKQISIEDLLAKAEQGDVDAQLDLGYNYLYGVNGVNTDYEKALHFYKLAAEQKNPTALNNLGSLYFSGLGTNIDYSLAIKYFDKAAQLGSNDAAVNLAIIYLGSAQDTKSAADLEKAFQLLEQAKSTNNSAKFLLGYAYYKGVFVDTDFNKAFQLIKTAADAQYDEAQFTLAQLYIEGSGTPKNYNKAIQYLQNAAEQGYPEALMLLADIYTEGKIYNENIKQAYILYNLASVLNINDAADKRDELEKRLGIDDILSVQKETENYQFKPSELTQFIRKTFGNSLHLFIDANTNFKAHKKNSNNLNAGDK